MTLAERIGRHADALERGNRSPLYVELMRAAAASAAVDDWPGGETRVLATSGDHGPPVRWMRPEA